MSRFLIIQFPQAFVLMFLLPLSSSTLYWILLQICHNHAMLSMCGMLTVDQCAISVKISWIVNTNVDQVLTFTGWLRVTLLICRFMIQGTE